MKYTTEQLRRRVNSTKSRRNRGICGLSIKQQKMFEEIFGWETNTRITLALSFEQAREIVRPLKLVGQRDWNILTSGKRPVNVPSNPAQWYASKGWRGWPDFLGYDGRLPRGYARSFVKAKELVHTLKLKSQKEWNDYCKSGEKPADIPTSPVIYKEWNGWPDWLGYRGLFSLPRPFKQARAFIQNQGFKKWDDFRTWKNRPKDIPTKPWAAYRDKGWINIGDFLGTFKVYKKRPEEQIQKLVALAKQNGSTIPTNHPLLALRYYKPNRKLFLTKFKKVGSKTHGKWVLKKGIAK